MTRRTAGCVSSNGAAAGVVTTSSGPSDWASARSSGVVRTTSPRKAVWMTRLVNLEHRQEGFLRDLHCAHLLHALLSFFLFLQELALPGDVAPVALGGHVLAQRSDGLARDNLGADSRLDHHLEQLPRNELPELLGDLAPPLVRLVTVDDHAERVHRLTVEQHIEPHQIRGAVGEKLVVQRGVAAGDRL